MFLFGGDLFFSFGRFLKKKIQLLQKDFGRGREEIIPHICYISRNFFLIAILKGRPQLKLKHS
jgi:hypothetical protein